MKEQFNDCVESVKGAWEYTRDAKTGQISVHYYKPDDDKPYVSIHVTQDEFNDLESLFGQIKKYGDKDENLEIERKFLLKKLPHAVPDDVILITQWYSKPGIEPFRIRMSMSMKNGVSHTYTEKQLVSDGIFIENERTISHTDYINYRVNCDRLIKKSRLVYPLYHAENPLKWEVDNYYDFDLIVAEIELPTLEHEFEIESYMADVIDAEITGDQDYSNSKLAIKVPKKDG